MRRFVCLLLVRLLLAASVLLTLTLPALAGESRILRVTYLSNPGVVDVTVTALSFDKTIRTITVTGTVRCAAGFDVWIMDFSVTQAQVSDPAVAFDPPCEGTFSQVMTATEGSFRPGRVTIQINALACALGCGEETVLIEAVLIPDKGL